MRSPKGNLNERTTEKEKIIDYSQEQIVIFFCLLLAEQRLGCIFLFFLILTKFVFFYLIPNPFYF